MPSTSEGLPQWPQWAQHSAGVVQTPPPELGHSEGVPRRSEGLGHPAGVLQRPEGLPQLGHSAGVARRSEGTAGVQQRPEGLQQLGLQRMLERLLPQLVNPGQEGAHPEVEDNTQQRERQRALLEQQQEEPDHQKTCSPWCFFIVPVTPFLCLCYTPHWYGWCTKSTTSKGAVVAAAVGGGGLSVTLTEQQGSHSVTEGLLHGPRTGPSGADCASTVSRCGPMCAC